MKKKSIRSFVGIAFLSLALSACSSMLPGMNSMGGDNGGNTGDVNQRGGSMHTGYGMPSNDFGEVGDLYLDLSTYELYVKDNDGWRSTGSLKGQDGRDGQDGQDGRDGRDGQDGQDAQANDLGLVFYSLNDREYAVGMGTAQFLQSSITIPSTYEDKPVTAIAENGFKDSNLTAISIPSSITSIGAHAFENCVNLSAVNIPTSVTSIGEKAFAGCSQLGTVSLGNVRTIGDYAFGNCSRISSITIPTSVNQIGEGAFYQCTRLSTLNYAGTQSQWESIGKGQFWYVGTRVKIINCSNGSFNIQIYNEEVLKSLDYCYHLVGGYEKSWVPSKNDEMEAASVNEIWRLDNKLGSTLSEKDVENLYKIQITILDREIQGTSKTIFRNKVRDVNNNLAFRVSQTTYVPQDDRYEQNVYIPDNGNFNTRNRAEALTSNIFIPAYQSEPDLDGFSWNNLSIMNVRPGQYIFVLAKYSNVNQWSNNANYGFGLIALGDGGDMITNDPFEEVVDPNEPAKTYSATYYDEDGTTKLAEFSANTTAELLNFDKKIPTKDPAGNTEYIFKNWVLVDRDEENNSFTFKASYEGCTRGLVFRENVVYQYTGMTKDVVIPSRWNGYDITTISNRCFQSTDIESVEIPDSITRIEYQAFESCKKLTSIVIPDSVIYLDGSVFASCELLESVTLSDNLTSINYGAFQNCYALKNIEFPSRLTSIDDYSFRECRSLESVEIPDTVTRIGYEAFHYCRALKNVQFSSSLTSISGYAFGSCTSLESITLPAGLTTIEYRAFESCSALTDVVIPESVTYIGDNAFSNCGSLIIRMTSEYKPKDFDSNWGGNSTVIYGYVDTVEVDGFTYILSKREDYKYANLVSFDIEGVTDFVAPASVSGYELASINLKPFNNNPYIETVDLSNASALTTIGPNTFYGCTSLKTVILPEGVTSIGNYAFQNCSSLETIIIPDSVTSIGYSAFYNCSSLKTVTFGNNSKLNNLGDSCFSNCYALRSIEIPDGVTVINGSTFSNCNSLRSAKLSNSLTNISSSAFWCCTSLYTIDIPDSVTTIGSNAFYGCYSLASVTLGSGVREIGGSAFGNDNNLYEVINKSALPITPGNTNYGNIGNYAKQIITDESKSKINIDNDGFVTYDGGTEVYLVGYLGNDEDVVIPDNVTRINRYAFYYNQDIKSVTLGVNILNIQQGAFCCCFNLRSVTVLGVNTNVEYYSFESCYNMVELINKTGGYLNNEYEYHRHAPVYHQISNESESWLNEDANGFITVENGNEVYLVGYEGNASEVVIPENVTIISNYVFYNNKTIKSVVIPENVKSIRDSAFYGCESIQAVFYTGSLDQWRNTSVGSNNSYAFYNNVYVYSENEPEYIGLWWHYEGNNRVIW